MVVGGGGEGWVALRLIEVRFYRKSGWGVLSEAIKCSFILLLSKYISKITVCTTGKSPSVREVVDR